SFVTITPPPVTSALFPYTTLFRSKASWRQFSHGPSDRSTRAVSPREGNRSPGLGGRTRGARPVPRCRSARTAPVHHSAAGTRYTCVMAEVTPKSPPRDWLFQDESMPLVAGGEPIAKLWLADETASVEFLLEHARLPAPAAAAVMREARALVESIRRKRSEGLDAFLAEYDL